MARFAARARRHGGFTLGERPGLGWELDEDFIQKYRVTFPR